MFNSQRRTSRKQSQKNIGETAVECFRIGVQATDLNLLNLDKETSIEARTEALKSPNEETKNEIDSILTGNPDIVNGVPVQDKLKSIETDW